MNSEERKEWISCGWGTSQTLIPITDEVRACWRRGEIISTIESTKLANLPLEKLEQIAAILTDERVRE